MIYLLAFLLFLGLVAIFANQLRAFRDNPTLPTEEAPLQPAECATCTDETDSCTSQRMLAGLCQPIVYFEDEELDIYKGRPSDAYTEAEEEDFREVLFSMNEAEVADWLRSLSLRDIALPDALKDEAFMLAGKG